MENKKTRLYCEKCDKIGIIDYNNKNGDLMGVLYMLEDDHKRLSPKCEVSTKYFDGYKLLRVITELNALKSLRKKLGFIK